VDDRHAVYDVLVRYAAAIDRRDWEITERVHAPAWTAEAAAVV
jgi:hypothetical protein